MRKGVVRTLRKVPLPSSCPSPLWYGNCQIGRGDPYPQCSEMIGASQGKERQVRRQGEQRYGRKEQWMEPGIREWVVIKAHRLSS